MSAESGSVAGRMKVAVVGCGAVGLNYGLRLLESELSYNHPIDVNFLTRRDYELIKAGGVRFESAQGNHMQFTGEQLAGKVYKDSADLAAAKGRMHWVLIAVKSYSIDESLHQTLLKLHQPQLTRYLVILNGLGVESAFADWFGADCVFGGISFVAINRGPNPPLPLLQEELTPAASSTSSSTAVSSSAASPSPSLSQPAELGNPQLLLTSMHDGMLHVGHSLDDITRLDEVRQLFAASKELPLLELKENLLSARWQKLVLNLVFSGLGVALGGVTIDFIERDPSLRQLAERIIEETVAIANADIALNYQQLHPSNTSTAATVAKEVDGDSNSNGSNSSNSCPYLLDLQQMRVLAWEKARGAGAYKMSAVVDLLEGRQVELSALFWPPVRAAERLQIPLREYLSLSNLVLTVEAVCRMAQEKCAMGVKWTPTYVVGSM